MHIILTKKCVEGQLESPNVWDIEHFHWVEDGTVFEGFYTQVELCDFIQNKGAAFIIDPRDPTQVKRLEVSVGKNPEGRKYARILVNGQETDYLLGLPECE